MRKCIFFLLLFLGIAFAEEPYPKFSFDDFTEGLNRKDAPNKIKRGQCSDCQNVLFDEKLGIVTRDKYDFICSLPVSTTTKILGSYVYSKDDGSTLYLVQAGSTVYSTTQLSKDTIWTVVKTGLSQKYPVRWATHYNKTWGVNGVDVDFSFDGTNTADYSFMPKGQFILSANGRIWIASTFDNPNFVYFSEINVDPTTSAEWLAVNVFKIGLGDGQIIKGIDKIGNTIVIWKDKSIYGILGNAESSADDYMIKQYFTDFGSVSDNSISDYLDGKNFLDKKGLYFWNGGNIQNISEIIKPDIDKIGMLSTGYGKWNITSKSEFDEGSYENCWNNGGAVEVSTSAKTWTTTADFQGTGYSVSQATATNGEIKLYGTEVSGLTGFPNISIFPGSVIGDLNNINDDNYESYAVLEGTIVSSDLTYPKYSQYIITLRKSSVLSTIQLVKMKLKNIGIDTIGIYISFINTTGETTYGLTTPNVAVDETKEVNWILNLINIIEIRIEVQGFERMKDVRTLFYEISVYAQSEDAGFSTGTYTSPIYDSGQTTTQYQSLTPTEYLGTYGSSGTITYYARTDDASNMSSPTTWYQTTSSFTDTAIDGQRYFQWKSELWTSSVTATPTCYDTTLQYATTSISTYTSKVFYEGKRISSQGSFVTSDEGTVNYQIRSATWTFSAISTVTISGSQSTQWTTISNNSDLTISTANVYIQWRGILNTKNSKIQSVTINWFEGIGGGGGTQSVASINFNNRYYLATSTWTTHNDVIYIFDKNKAWTKFTGIPVSSFFKYNNNLYVCSSTQPIILQMYVPNGSEPPFNAFWKSGFVDFDSPNKDKDIRYSYLTGTKNSSYALNFDYTVNNSTITNTYYQSFSDSTNNKKPLAGGTVGKNFYFMPRSTNAFELQGIDLYYLLENLK